jgi:hypothetical protein
MENYNRVEKVKYVTIYYLNDKLHRLDGPAYEGYDGYKEWWKNDELHRIDGPAVEYSNGNKYWYYEGKKIDCKSQEEFERLIKLKLFW